MSSLFDVPAQLAMLLSLAASTAATDSSAVSVAAEHAAPVADVAVVSEPLEGPLRFGERAWLRALHENAKEAETIGARVFVTSGGRYYIPSPNDRDRILAARNDAELGARVARASAERNAARMRAALHRAPTAGDLYIAHVFGVGTAISLLKAAGEAPDTALAKLFPSWPRTLRKLPAVPRHQSPWDNSIAVSPARCASLRASSPSACGRPLPIHRVKIWRPRQTTARRPSPGRRKSMSPRRTAALSSGTARPARAHRGCGRDRTS